MNYQHAFHAGNFADVHKHIVLTRVLDHLRQKPAAFRVVDTHAGAGRYELFGPQAARSGEWRDGIGRLFAMPRSGAAASLESVLRGDARAKALAMDGWMALFANIPPKERRGLVVIDPPYEESIDFARLSETLAQAHRKWANGVYLLWYPIKARAAPDALARRLRRLAVPKILRCELTIAPPRADGAFAGSGLIIVNPPFPLQRELQVVLPVLTRLLAPMGAYRLDWLSRE